MKPESKFQERVIARIKGLGGQAIHLEPIGHAGFPDLLVVKGDKYVLVELKSVARPSKARFASIFEPGQLAWHSKWLTDTGRAVVTLVEFRNTGRVMLYYFDVPGEGVIAYSSTINEVLEDWGSDSEERVIDNVLRYL